MSRLSLLILDANVVIYLHECGTWQRFIDACDVHVPRTVVDEAEFYDTDGHRIYIDLQRTIEASSINVFDVDVKELESFSKKFDPLYLGELDPGELEALAFLCSSPEQFAISSGDAIVYRVLGRLNRADQGISLEEALQQLGLQQAHYDWPYTKAFRQRYTQDGVTDFLQGRGLRRTGE